MLSSEVMPKRTTPTAKHKIAKLRSGSAVAHSKNKIWLLILVIPLVILLMVFRSFVDYRHQHSLPYTGDSLDPEQILAHPDFPLPAHTPKQHILRRSGFTLCYNHKYKQPEWVAYELRDTELIAVTGREKAFSPDPDLGDVYPQDYNGSGYDRGHLAPAADMKFSKQAEQECFYMSNISPQKPDFNRGIWEKLEHKVRTWAKTHTRIFVVTGPILKDEISEYIGRKTKIGVPKRFFKALLVISTQKTGQAIGFILPNSGSTETLSNFACTINKLEKETGYDFFPMLPDEIEKKLESDYSLAYWKL